MITNKHHQALVKLFESHQNLLPDNGRAKKYLGTSKTYYNLKTAGKVKIIKTYLKSANLTSKDFTGLLLSLSHGSSFEELSAMGIILGNYSSFRQQLPTGAVSQLFNNVEGWAETDITCTFSPDDLLADWPGWKKLLTDFNVDKNIHKRRASLVLLTLPLRDSSDMKFIKLALKNIDKLKSEKDILIIKAISWVLRSMIKFHPDIVRDYLEKNKNTLPRIAVREVSTKLLTGKKYVNGKKK